MRSAHRRPGRPSLPPGEKTVAVTVFLPRDMVTAIDDAIADDASFSSRGHYFRYLVTAAPIMWKELDHLVSLLTPMEENGKLTVPGLATLNDARAALALRRSVK